MKLSKKGICVLSLSVVLLVIGCFASNSVDYDETEVYNEINFIKKFLSMVSSTYQNTVGSKPFYYRVKTNLPHIFSTIL